MKATQVPQTQPFAPRQLKSVEQGETKFMILSDAGTKAKGLRTDGVAPCIVLCGRIAGANSIALGMNHWAGIGSSGMSSSVPTTGEQETHMMFRQFCDMLRRKAIAANIATEAPMEIICIGGERQTQETRGTEEEQRLLTSCLSSQEYINRYKIDPSCSGTYFNVKELEEGRLSIYLLESEVYYKKYRGEEIESVSYHSGSSGSSSPELRAEFTTFKEEITEQMKKQSEKLQEQMEKQNQRIDALVALLEQRHNEERPEKRQRRDPSFLGNDSPSP